MANIMQIDYLYQDKGKLLDFARKVANTNVSFDWDAIKCQIKITWEGEQKKQVVELLNLIRDHFKEPIITIINEENTMVNDEGIYDDVEANEEEDPQKQEVSIKREHENEVELSMDDEQETIDTAPLEKTSDNVEKELVTCEELVENLEASDNAKSDALKGEITHTFSAEEYENALKELLGAKVNEYDFVLKPENAATKFCLDYKIKNETIRLALTLIGVAPNKHILIKGIARVQKKNVALVEVELSGAFKRWMANTYPDFMEMYPDVKLIHFLNIFRKENNKF